MFWAGIIIALLVGQLPIPIFRNFFRNFFPMITDNQVDLARIIIVIFGVSISCFKYVSDRYEITALQNKVAYQEVAGYNISGNKSGSVNGVPMVRTPINDWNKEFVTRKEGKIVCKCSPSAINVCRQVIEKLPQYPFSYYVLARCLKENGDQSWKEYSIKAKFILENTTKIPGHHPDHDLILQELM